MTKYEKIYLSISFFTGVVGYFTYKLYSERETTLPLTISLKVQSEPLERVKIKLYRNDTLLVDSAVTNYDGKVIFDNLVKGNYLYMFKFRDHTYFYDVAVKGSSEIVEYPRIRLKTAFIKLTSTTHRIKRRTTKLRNNLPDSIKRIADSIIASKSLVNSSQVYYGVTTSGNVLFRAQNLNDEVRLYVDGAFLCKLNIFDTQLRQWRFEKITYLSPGSHFYTINGLSLKHNFNVDSLKKNNIYVENSPPTSTTW